MSDDLWAYAEAIARELARDPMVTAVRDAFAAGDRWHPGRQGRRGWQGVLDQSLNMFGSQMRSMPLQVGKYLAYVPMVEGIVNDPSGRQWFEKVNELANTQHSRVELLRSRLPGYPFLRVPHLLPAGPLGGRDVEFGSYLWERGVRRMGLQLVDTLPDANQQIQGAINGLARALSLTEEWEGFSSARARLDEDDKAALSEVGRWMTETIADERIEEIRSLLARGAARRGVLGRAVARLPERARGYCLAFEQVNALIDAVMCVAERVSVFGGPPRLPTPDRIYMHGNGIEARWEVGYIHMDLGAPAILDASILRGVLRVEGYTTHFAKDGPGVFKARFSMLKHSRAWWERERPKIRATNS